MAKAVRPRVSSPRLVGRDAELDALVDFAASLRDGEPGVALVSGRAGSGKTRLVTELAGASRARLLVGSCPPSDAAGPPYLPLLSALRPALPDDAPVLAALNGTGRVNRSQLFELLRLAVEALARRGRLVLVVEDLHWADRATQHALLYLLGQARCGRWGLVATARPDGRAGTAGVLAAALESRPALRLSLGTLSVEEVGEQITAITGLQPSADDAGLVHRRSGGIPLLVEEVVAAGTEKVPDHLRAMFLARVKAAGDAVTDVVGVAAVVERGYDEGVIAQILATDARTVREAAQAGVESDLLVVDHEGYRVRHDLLREAVYDALPPGLRRDLHSRAAHVLSKLGGVEPAELAHHWNQAGRPEETARASMEAAVVAEMANAPASTHAHLERVLSLWPRLSEDQRVRAGGRAEILRRAAVAAERDGAYAAAVALTEERLTIGPANGADAALAWERLARYRWEDGDGPGSQAAYERAVELLPLDASPDVRAKVLSGHAWFLGVSLQTDRAAFVSQQALAACSGVSDPSVRWQVLLSWGIARLGREDGYRALEEARDLAVSLDEGYDVAISDLWRNLSLRHLGRFSECETVLTDGLRYAAAHGVGRSVEAALSYMIAERMLELGRWDEAASVIDSNRRRGVSGIPGYFTSGYRARLAAFRGDGEVVAEAVAETSARAADIPQQPLPLAIALLARVEQYLWSGAAERAIPPAVEALSLAAGDLCCRADALALLARSVADDAQRSRVRGRSQIPDVTPEDLLRRADEWETAANDRVHAFTVTTRAEVDRMNGAREPGAWQEVVDAWTSAGDPYRSAYTRWRLGWALLGSRSGRTEATRQLRSAHLAASALGAEPLRAAIEDLVATARLHVGPLSGPNAAAEASIELGLTGRELDVLPLLVAGRTNAEIARILVISPRTVGVHVSRILHKLGAGRRTEAADIARRTGLLDR